MVVRVKFLKDFKSGDKEFKSGEVYEVDKDYAEFLVNTKQVAELVTEDASDDTDDIVARIDEAFEKQNAEFQKALNAINAKFSTLANSVENGVSRKLNFAAIPKDEDEDRRGGFKSLSHFVHEVIAAGPQLKSMSDHLANYISKAPSGLNVLNDSDGGFLVPVEFSDRLIDRLYNESPFTSRTMRMSTSRNSLRIPGVDETSRANGSRSGGIQAFWLTEADQVTTSKPKFRQIQLELHKVAAIAYMTDEMLEDSTNMDSWLFGKLQQEIDFVVNDSILNGTGAGKPLGILNAPALVEVSAAQGQAGDTVVFDNIVSMWSRLYAPSRQNAVWFIHQDVEPQLMALSLVHGTSGTAAYLPPGGLSGTPYGTLLGRPVIVTEHNKTVGDVGDIVLADLSQYVFLTKSGGGVSSAMSMHLRFDYFESALRVGFRCDGQPLWQDPLTPFSGSNTQSPFIALKAR